MNFQHKVVVVTGSGAGIGRETAIQFARHGAQVVVASLNRERGSKVVRYIQENTNGEAFFVQTDVSDSSSVKAMVEQTLQRFKNIHILVNNAGVYYQGDVVETGEEEWDRIMAVNLKGAFLCSRYIVPFMLKNESGIIINVSSEAGLVGIAGQVAYNVSKTGLIALTKSMAVDYGRKGIRVNAVCPGTTETPLVQNVIEHASEPDRVRSDLESARPLNRLGQPEEIAKAIVALSSDELGFATGAVLAIDGGYTAQ